MLVCTKRMKSVSGIVSNLFGSSFKMASSESVQPLADKVVDDASGSSTARSPGRDVSDSGHTEWEDVAVEGAADEDEDGKGSRKRARSSLRNHPVKTQRLMDAFTEEKVFDETDYHFEHGLRKVYPYYFKYETHAKGRWYGKKLLDVISQEFRLLPYEEYIKAIETGRVRVNEKKVTTDYVIRSNDLLTNSIHRHEQPISDSKIEIIHEDEDLLVVNKPASMPVHPCGRYRHNSLIFIISRERGMRGLRTVHRLDRLTSGVLIMAKRSSVANKFMEDIKARNLEKEYVCRVEGRFPEGRVVCQQPVEHLNRKLGLVWITGGGRECHTEFEKIGGDAEGKWSVVKCYPRTGRTHQIRIHLQYLGHPISNDSVYNSSKVWGEMKGKDGKYGKSREEIVADVSEEHRRDNWIDFRDEEEVKAKEVKAEEVDRKYYEPGCMECKVEMKEPGRQHLIMYLHALRYKGNDWEFSTPLPEWAHDNYCEPTDS